jgi:uncharacterized membrane protein
VAGDLMAFRWTEASGFAALGALEPPPLDSSAARAISGDGTTIVGVSDRAGGEEAFRWTALTGVSGLGVLSPTVPSSAATAVSADGSIVVGTSVLPPSDTSFIWDAPGGMRSLQQLLVARGARCAAGWRSLRPTGISADGRIVAGSGTNPAGLSESWIADLGGPAGACYANCDGSTGAPVLSVADFNCFIAAFAAGDPRANCDCSAETAPLNVNDFVCFTNVFAAGCP